MSREAELTTALEQAWAELERKQSYIQNAFDSAAKLQQELDELKASSQAAEARYAAHEVNMSGNSGTNPELQTALEGAWAELENKQRFLESSFDEIRARDVELELLRQEVAALDSVGGSAGNMVQPNVQRALTQAWNDLEARDLQILNLNATIEALNGRVEWLLLENKTLSGAIGVDKLRQ
jgi:septal ring factor EnvC (AmiA/AmiB activator)